MFRERQLPEDVAILTESQENALVRLEEEESRFRFRVERLDLKEFTLDGDEEVKLLISKHQGCEEDDVFAIDLEIDSTKTRVCSFVSAGTVVDKSHDPCELDDLLRLGRVLDLFEV